MPFVHSLAPAHPPDTPDAPDAPDPPPPPPPPPPPSLANGDDGREDDAIVVTWPAAPDVRYELSITGPSGERIVPDAAPSRVSGLEEATGYTFRLRTVHEAGASPWSLALETCTRPRPPQISFRVTSGMATACISWECRPPAPGDLELVVDISGATVIAPAPLASSHTLSAASTQWTARACYRQPHARVEGGINLSRWSPLSSFVVEASPFLWPVSPVRAPSVFGLSHLLRGRYGGW